ncbi:uncharacterized protein EI90DRAFT_3065726 [Cantharellus anzutake]|uniref:uncharacterized protein n=1 Tax=Cantharellus anzutake TaxID=1750568 RepID=UPI001904E5CA|nr:uncharacterized protein EI90DRAFT_3065726 [Cantharellus anzutake]KAF8328146.1 hypothetical protein EI90DRAFT_3065726 [Cantharellus anzutake]
MVSQFAVTADLYYLNPPDNGEKPWTNVNANNTIQAITSPPNFQDRNYNFVKHSLPIHPVQSDDPDITLDRAGFQFYRRPSKEKTFDDEEQIKAEYYQESIGLIKELTGANRVVVFDHTIRRSGATGPNTPDNRQPVTTVHVDQTPEAAENRVKRHLPPEDVSELLSKRHQIINLWRPFSHVAQDWPLALADYRHLDYEKDLTPVTLKYPDREGETFGVKFNERHKWYYMKDMTPDDLVLIKCFDSKTDEGISRLTPHTAFFDTAAPTDAPPRHSIEIRALVFYP